MSFMKKNVNFGLMILIVATVLLFIGFTIYYQNTYSGLSGEYQQKIDELDKLTSSLQAEKTKLSETSYELKIKEESEQDLSGKYEGIKSEKEKLEVDKTNLQQDLASTKSNLAVKEVELTTTKNDLEIANEEVSSLKSKISSKNNEINSLEARISCLQSTADDSEGNC